MAFDHADAGSEALLPLEERAPGRLFERAPETLRALVEEVTSWDQRLGTTASWIDAALMRAGSEGESDPLKGYFLSAREVLQGEARQRWSDSFSVSASHARLALALAKGSTTERRVLTEREVATLLSPPDRSKVVPLAENVRAAVEMFERLGITWEHAEANVERRREAARRAQAGADHDRGDALLEAASRDDLEAVRELLRSGANTQKRCRRGQLDDYPLGDKTALHIAVQRRHLPIVALLLEHGAHPDQVSDGKTTLCVATVGGNVELARLLLAHGADPTFTNPPLTGEVLAAAGSNPQAPMIRLLLDAGAPLPASRWCERMMDAALDQGADDLVARLQPGCRPDRPSRPR
jgi:hypothetical protein